MKMMKIDKIGFSIIAVLFLSISIQAQDKVWTLQECVNYALENNISVKQINNSLLSGEQDVKASKGSFLPTLNASASQTLGLGNQELFQGQFADRTTHSTNIGIRATQNVFNGFRTSYLYKQSLLNQEANQLQLQKLKDDISLNVANAYLNVLFNKENLETAKAQVDFSQAQLNQVQDLVEAGVQPQANVYDAEATLASDEQSLTIAENNYNIALLTLSQILQIPREGFQVEMIDVGSPTATLMYNNVEPILDYAFDNRSEIKLAEKNIEVAEMNTKISKSGFLPNVNLSYAFGSNAFYSNLIDTEDTFFNQLNDQKAHSFSLSIGIPIFSQFQNKTSVTKAKISVENSKLDLAQSKLDLENTIQTAFTDAKAALKSYEASKKAMQSQELAFENAQERYNLGAMNAFDLEQSRIRYVNAQSALINAKYDFIFKTKVLDFYIGKPIVINNN
ncbi:TolC family protein [Mangrovimonas spongiae]|uniref:TolC family protein n=2 Tax=Mangrovimonas spongiae TaxID=2494697 RepID=A0A3R9MDY7_9FLAO|nr:TolC family protein [Mangrovimonas spongiae]